MLEKNRKEFDAKVKEYRNLDSVKEKLNEALDLDSEIDFLEEKEVTFIEKILDKIDNKISDIRKKVAELINDGKWYRTKN